MKLLLGGTTGPVALDVVAGVVDRGATGPVALDVVAGVVDRGATGPVALDVLVLEALSVLGHSFPFLPGDSSRRRL